MFGREVKAKVENKNQNVYNLQRNTKVLAAYDGCGGTKQGRDIAGMCMWPKSPLFFLEIDMEIHI